jgi:hypothetical protein
MRKKTEKAMAIAIAFNVERNEVPKSRLVWFRSPDLSGRLRLKKRFDFM